MQDDKKSAAKAALAFINPGQSIGLGAGTTIAHLVHYIKEDTDLSLSIQIFTSSSVTRLLLQENGFTTRDTSSTDRIDTYFDGCDQVDHQLNALKSGGGIHTSEKLLAAMADEFILLADHLKYVKRLDNSYPIVIEVIPDAVDFVCARIKRIFSGVTPILRRDNKNQGPVITENRNMLIDIWFASFPEPAQVNPRLKEIPGILESSLFYNMAHKAIIASNGIITIHTNKR